MRECFMALVLLVCWTLACPGGLYDNGTGPVLLAHPNVFFSIGWPL